MSKSMLIAILVIGSALWVWGLWKRGFFGPETLPVERRVYSMRLVLFFISLFLVSWPLELYRKEIGEVAYVASAAAILGLFFGIGWLAARLMFKHHAKGLE